MITSVSDNDYDMYKISDTSPSQIPTGYSDQVMSLPTHLRLLSI
jgi:hypothetical protein